MWALEPVYHSTFLEFVALILRDHEKGFNGAIAFEMHLVPKLLQVLLTFSPSPFV